MDTTLAIKIGVAIFAVVLVVRAIGWPQAGRRLKARKQAFQDRGASWSLGLGTCLSGLPGLEQPARVNCGGTATELILVADDNRELCRIPWSSIRDIFGGKEEETLSRLRGTDTLPSLVLAQSDHSRGDGRHQYVPSYVVIDWTDGASRRQQAVFEFPDPNFGALVARSLTLQKTVADHR
jgi:hypothetical protein